MKDRVVLVLGGTGHIGQAVVRRALAAGDLVTVVSRHRAPRALADMPVQLVHDPEGRLSALESLCNSHDVLVDAAATAPLGWSRAHGALVAEATSRMEHVAAAARRTRTPLIYVSSFTAGSTVPAHLRAASPYFAVKDAMEEVVRAACLAGLDAVIARPGPCLGPWEYRPRDQSLVALVLDRQLPWVSASLVNVIDVRDLAELLFRLLDAGHTRQPIMVAGHDIGLEALVREIAVLGAVSAPVPLAPAMAWMAGAWAGRALAWYGGRDARLDVLPLIAASRSIAPGEVQSTLGVAMRPLAATLRDAVDWHLATRVTPHRDP